MSNHIKLTICGTDYRLTTNDTPEYALALGLEVEEKIKALREANPTLSLVQATTLVALDYADSLKKNDSSADNLRVQVKDYLEDAAKAKGERDYYKRELERVKAQLQSGQTNLFD
ncbi:MAG: cell division protein ZapA [Ruminococcaceae bacterium]|jgi:cell division protein ZapA|nr:cell division protein ZapA [Oscillospiraceae bacterium]